MKAIIKYLVNGFILLTLLILTALGIIASKGLPSSLIYLVQENLHVNHKQISTEAIQISLLQGITVHKLNIFDSDKPDEAIFKANRIHLQHNNHDLLNGKINISSLSLHKASMALELTSDQQSEKLLISDTNAEITHENNELIIKSFSARSGRIKLDIDGSIKNLDEIPTKKIEVSHDKRFHFNQLSSRLICQQIPPQTRKSIIKIISFLKSLPIEEDIQLSAKLQLDFAKPEKSQVTLDVNCPAFLYQGIEVNESNCRIAIREDGILHISKLGVFFDTQEYIQGDIKFNINRKSLSGKIRLNTFPDKLLKVFAPNQRRHLSFLQFHEAVSAEVEILKINIPLLSKGILNKNSLNLREIIVRGKKLGYRGMNVLNYSGELNVIGKHLQANNVALLSEKLNGTANIYHNFKSRDLFVDAELVGDPRELKQFVPFKQTQKILDRIWQDFEWSEIGPPHFTGVYHNCFSADNTPYNTFEGKLHVLGAKYRGVATESLKADIYVHRNAVVLDQLETTIEGTPTKLDIAIHPILTPGHVDIVAKNCKASVKKILSFISLDLPKKLKKIHFQKPSIIHDIQCTIPIADSMSSIVKAKLYNPEVKIIGHPFLDNHIELLLKNKILSIDNPSSKFYKGFASFSYRQDITENQFNLDLNLQDLSYAQLTSSTKNDSFTSGKGKINGHAQIMATFGDIGLANIEGDGHIRITDGDFIKIPFLSSFFSGLSSILPLSKSVSQVTELYSEIKFKDQRAICPKIVSNGKLVSFDAKGHYNWLKETLDYKININYLSQIFTLPKPFNYDIISKIVSGASGVSKASLTGTISEPKWDIIYMENVRSFFKKIGNTLSKPFKSKTKGDQDK